MLSAVHQTLWAVGVNYVHNFQGSKFPIDNFYHKTNLVLNPSTA